MEYANLIYDFAWRTLQNLDHVKEQEDLGNEGVYPVTQLWNSLLGLIVAPRERELERIPNTPMTQLWSQGWPRLTTTTGTEPETLSELLRNLRNAVAHFNVEFKPGPDREITSVEVWNQTPRGGPDMIWKGQITVEDLNSLARQVAKLYLENFASTAA